METVDKGADVLVRHQSSKHGTRSFCGKCGSPLFCESTNHPKYIDIVLANLDGPIDKAPQFHAYYDNRADWTQIGDELPQLKGDSADD